MRKNSSKNWFVLYTKPRMEIKVMQQLLDLGLEAYTPYKLEIRQWSDRKKKVKTPLLPSIVLVSIKENELNKVFEVTSVLRYLFENGRRAIVLNEEVLAMKLYLDNAIHHKVNLVVGDYVKVPVLNEEAKIITLKGKNCIAQLRKMGALVSFQLR